VAGGPASVIMDDIPIIMYHSVNDRPAENPMGHLSISPPEFEAHLHALTRLGFEFITMAGLLEMARAGRLGDSRWVVLTFDDGYLDNLLHAKPILDAFGAKATVFVNPDFVTDGRVRTLADVPNGWGYLNWQELEVLERSGFDVQSHTWSHDRVFLGPRVTDVYTSDKFPRYYWLTQLLAPGTKPQWEGDVSRFATVVSDGYPIFEHGRALAGRQFIPDDKYVSECLAAFQAGGEEEVRHLGSAPQKKGDFESPKAWANRTERELGNSKRVIEDRLSKRVDTVCFPGGVYNKSTLRAAGRSGYKIYMRSSRDSTIINNRSTLAEHAAADRPDVVGLSRISFTSDYPRRFLPRAVAYWNARLKIDAFLRPSKSRPIMRMVRGIRNGIRQAKTVRR
jgi:peptidoglycan/xylan/chitin deacetylase (PgdA/CDA1 family)